MKFALAQINPTIGDLAGNTARILAEIDSAQRQGAQVVVFPELAVCGYPPKDLLLKPAFIERCQKAVEQIALGCTSATAIVGYPCPSDQAKLGRSGRALFNAAAICQGRQVVGRAVKSLLPTYDVFDELRYFQPAATPQVVDIGGVKIGLSICEDLWNEADIVGRPLYDNNPIQQLAQAGAQVIVNCSASPFVAGKHDYRRTLFSYAAGRHKLPLLFTNQVGGNDELIFDGNSCVFDTRGTVIAHAKDFQEDLLLVDIPVGPGAVISPGRIEAPRRGVASLYHALVLGLADYCRKCGFKKIVLGLSGGIDSAVTAALAVAALGPANVTGITMPSRYSSPGSVNDSVELAKRLGIACQNIPIDHAHKAMEATLSKPFEGTAIGPAEENIQARLRGLILMSWSNKFGSLLVTTGNKSELAVGYCTLYGDMAGGLAVISDVPKTMIYELARWMNTTECPLTKQAGGPVIPQDSISKPPSAELRPNQKDTDSLPPYEILDQIIDRYVEKEQSPAQIATEAKIPPALVNKFVSMIDRNEYKRKQMPPGLKVTGRAFGFGRRMPIAQRYDAVGP